MTGCRRDDAIQEARMTDRPDPHLCDFSCAIHPIRQGSPATTGQPEPQEWLCFWCHKALDVSVYEAEDYEYCPHCRGSFSFAKPRLRGAPPSDQGPDPQEEARKDKLFAQANAIACVPEDAEPPLLPPITSAQFLTIRREAYEYLRAAHRQGFEEGRKAGREEQKSATAYFEREYKAAWDRVVEMDRFRAAAESRARTAERALRQISDDGECSCRDNDHDRGNAACALSIARAVLDLE